MDFGEPLIELRQLSWNQVVQKLYPAEVEEAKRIVGARAIEHNEMLLQEAEALREILIDCQEELQKQAVAKEWHDRMAQTPLREYLEKEIAMFVDALRQANSSDTDSAQDKIGIMTMKDLKSGRVVDYVLDKTSSASSRPSTGASSHRRPNSSMSTGLDGEPNFGWHNSECNGTDDYLGLNVNSASNTSSGMNCSLVNASVRPSSRASSATSRSSADSRPVTRSGLEDRQSIDLDEVEKRAEALRQVIAEEEELLLQDIEVLRQAIEHQYSATSKAVQPPPSIEEMQDVSQKLERELQLVNTFAKVDKQVAVQGSLRPRTAQKLKGTAKLPPALPKPMKKGDKAESAELYKRFQQNNGAADSPADILTLDDDEIAMPPTLPLESSAPATGPGGKRRAPNRAFPVRSAAPPNGPRDTPPRPSSIRLPSRQNK